MLKRTISAVRDQGLIYVVREALPHIHNHYIRERLWRKEKVLNGIKTRSHRIGDNIVPWQAGHPDPDLYEAAIIDSLRDHVRNGDSVLIVGGGWGVSTVVAAKETGEAGNVHTYEASPKYSGYVRETAALNDVQDTVTVTNKAVSHTVSTFGDDNSANPLHPSELTECDVLELDCEGAELSIISKMDIRPRTIIVETHGVYDSSTEEITEILNEIGYIVQSVELAERGNLESMCRNQDVRVVVAIRGEIC
ncbi:hypothetical protein C467_13942 [Halorubrum hochstenium ATCC 700873]|uniref:Methyltransferase FkbM domain-containing protein n=1 Tax=Halorubrum hochstenium ATCC 700873 TaxID=1227481 RepID=M0F072_9EURY|nr:hypothetical protein C467_13942 [Halorubrum hochstenium ATCC 700873]